MSQRSHNNVKFWIEDPGILVGDLTFLPDCEMSENGRLNAMTRLIIMISLVMFFFKVKSWYVFLICGLGLVILLYYGSLSREKMNQHGRHGQLIENYRCSFRKNKNPGKKKKSYLNIRPKK
jgi:uncharacterized membrane protein